MKNGKSIMILSTFLVTAVALSTIIFSTLNRGVSGSTNTYTATFSDVSGLATGDDVRVAGVRVGRVGRIELVGSLAQVTFQVERGQILNSGITASVLYQNILGRRYLGLSPGASAGGPLPDGGEIPLEQTVPSFDVSAMLNGFEPLFSTLDPQQVDNLTSALVNALQGDGGALLGLVTQTSALAESLAGPDEALGTVIASMNTLMATLAAQESALQSVIREVRQIMATLDGRQDELIESVAAISTTVGAISGQLDIVSSDLAEIFEREPGFTTVMAGESRERLSHLVANVPALLKGLSRVTQDGSYFSGYACNLNVSLFATLSRVVSGVVRLASPGNIVRNTAACR